MLISLEHCSHTTIRDKKMGGYVERWVAKLVRWVAKLARWVAKLARWVAKLVRWEAKFLRWVAKLERWVAKLVARLLATAVLWVLIQTSLKITKWATAT